MELGQGGEEENVEEKEVSFWLISFFLLTPQKKPKSPKSTRQLSRKLTKSANNVDMLTQAPQKRDLSEMDTFETYSNPEYFTKFNFWDDVPEISASLKEYFTTRKATLLYKWKEEVYISW